MANVERNYAFVGTTEQMELGLKLLEAVLPKFFKGATKLLYKRNVNGNPHPSMSGNWFNKKIFSFCLGMKHWRIIIYSNIFMIHCWNISCQSPNLNFSAWFIPQPSQRRPWRSTWPWILSSTTLWSRDWRRQLASSECKCSHFPQIKFSSFSWNQSLPICM